MANRAFRSRHPLPTDHFFNDLAAAAHVDQYRTLTICPDTSDRFRKLFLANFPKAASVLLHPYILLSVTTV